jgi:hypothetical protein
MKRFSRIRKAVRFHFMHSGASKSLKWCFKYVNGLWNNNLHCGRVLKRLWWCPWSDVSSCRNGRRNHFCIQCIEKSTWSKCSLSKRMALRTHKMTSGCLKNDFSDVDEAMFEGVERPRYVINWNVGIEKSDFFWSPISVALIRRMGVRNNNLPSGNLKKRLSLRRWSIFAWSRRPCEIIFCNLFIEKATFTISLKWFFK